MKRPNKKVIIFLVVASLLFWWVLSRLVIPNPEVVSRPYEKITRVGSIKIPLRGVNKSTILMSWLIMLVLIFISYYTKKRLKEKPGRWQVAWEFIVDSFDKFCQDSLGEKGRHFMPLVAALFLFVGLSNVIGVIPVPGFAPPTQDLNTTLSLGILCFFIAHGSGIYYKGFKNYVAGYFEPMIVIKGTRIPNVLIFPINVVGEAGKVISHSFRLFGNIMGGGVLIVVAGELTRQLFYFNTILQIFLGLFIGIVQAFVFSILALTYISVQAE